MDLIEKYLGENSKSDMENDIRDHLSGTNRKVDQKTMWGLVKSSLKGANKKVFDQVWKELIEDNYLIKASGNTYKWEM